MKNEPVLALHRAAIETVLEFANTPAAEVQKGRRYALPVAGPLLPSAGVLGSRSGRVVQPIVPSSVAAQEQREARHLLDLIVKDSKLNQRREQLLSDLLSNHVWARLAFADGRIRHSFEVIAGNRIDAFHGHIALGVALLFETGMASKLRMCALCNRFFVIWQARKHSKQYCSTECAREATSEKAVERMRKWRASKRKE